MKITMRKESEDQYYTDEPEVKQGLITDDVQEITDAFYLFIRNCGFNGKDTIEALEQTLDKVS